MIKVVKPMATLVTHILPIMEHNNVTMYQLFEIFEESCASFETCYPGGFINDKTIKGPGGQCLLKAIMEGTTMKDRTRATNIVQGLIESLPAKRKWFYAGMHWLVAMAKVD
ncbi:hypothetical protein BIW11_11333 [Tropilaelaps mercedesae]|uniref:Uncharacterized protein n=1 Tax=Tropilaelaps mercedesae TaxID=418985 RepID=A0A1V9XBH1_9ACAR|nr:hypothetical protein BIW11_11333 [Tropilaelaps mercedesae]